MIAIAEIEMVIGNGKGNAIGMAIAMVGEGGIVIEIETVIETEIDMEEEMNTLERGIMTMTAMRTPVLKEGTKESILNSTPVSSTHIQLVGIFDRLVCLVNLSTYQGKVYKL